MKTEKEQIDEMVKVIKGFDICGLFGRCFSTGADGENTRYITCPECFAEALYNAGYGDVKQAQIDVLNRVMTYINNKIENDYGDMSDSAKYLTINIYDFDDFIDELIKEVQNGEDKS